MKEVQKMLTPRDGCWIQKMVVVRASVLEESLEKDVSDCFLRCLLNGLCGLLTYDDENEKCILQTGNYYRVNAIDESLSSSSALLECILENNRETKASLCKNENLLFSSVLNAIMKGHLNWQKRLIQQFNDVKRAYDLTEDGVKLKEGQRHRRGWDTFDFLEDIPVIGHFYEILKSPTENKKLKEHVYKLQQRFQQFATNIVEDASTNRRFLNEVLEKVEAGFSHIYDEIHGLKCDVASLSSLMIFQQAIKTHELQLKQLFSSSRHGKLKTSIPEALSLEDLTSIVTNNPNYADSLYHTHPEVLYRVGELYLVSVLEGNQQLLFHYLLTAPKIKIGSIFQTYQPVTVPVTNSEDELCFEVNLPDTILYRDNKFYSADITDCYIKHEITLCQQDFEDIFSPSIQHLPCLDEDSIQCPIIPVPCITKMVFTKAGALTFSQRDILGMKRGESTKLSVITEPGKFTYFLEWQFFTMIQSDQRIMYSLDNSLTIRNLTWSSPIMSYNFKGYLADTSKHVILTNISLLQKKIENATILAQADFSPDFMGLKLSRKDFLDFSSIFSIVTTIISICVFIFLCCYHKIKKQSKILQLVRDIIKDDKRMKREEKLETKMERVNAIRKSIPKDSVKHHHEDEKLIKTTTESLLVVEEEIMPLQAPKVIPSTVTPSYTVEIDAYGSD
jgi:hypothetical protein